ncbi:hypothetical protein ACHAXA_010567 [Cyclostephanos tholiformis]|uniref:L domain-like protein n=1 Tax=Cyclostephanos tholiformis TaxID=382380 RepID=A0ABD3RC71_9STRA
MDWLDKEIWYRRTAQGNERKKPRRNGRRCSLLDTNASNILPAPADDDGPHPSNSYVSSSIGCNSRVSSSLLSGSNRINYHSRHAGSKQSASHSKHSGSNRFNSHSRHAGSKQSASHSKHSGSNRINYHSRHAGSKQSTSHPKHSGSNRINSYSRHTSSKQSASHPKHSRPNRINSHSSHAGSKQSASHPKHSRPNRINSHSSHAGSKQSASHPKHSGSLNSRSLDSGSKHLAPTFPPTPIPSTLNPTLTPSASPTQPCNLSPEERTTQIKELLSTVSDPALFDDPTTPQARALDWITNEDAIVPTLCPNFDGQGCKLDGQNPLVQRYSLATFYFATNGDAWNQCSAPENFDDAASVATANDGCNRVVTPFGVENERVGDTSTDAWLGPVNECFWGGVACWGSDTPNLNLCVDQLDFEDNGLTGVLVPELSVNPSMRFLILEQGNLTGTIPSEFGNLERLLIIDMDFNEITGTLPETLFDLSAMQQLDLNDNLITGTLSTRIGDMSSLTFLQIDHNKFSSTIPSEIGLMDNLRIAFLSVNDFTGVMPEEVCSLRNNTSTPGVLGVLVTDCSGSPPEVDCPCCSSCA